MNERRAAADKTPDRALSQIESVLGDVRAAEPSAAQARALCACLALIGRRFPDHEELPTVASHLREVLDRSTNSGVQIQLGYCLTRHFERVGDVRSIGIVARMLAPLVAAPDLTVMERASAHAIEAIHAWRVADWRACKEAVASGLKHAREVDVGVRSALLCASVCHGIASGSLRAAAAALRQLRESLEVERRPQRAMYHYLASWHAVVEDEVELAREHAGAAGALCRAAGEAWLQRYVDAAHAQLVVEPGDAKALDCLTELAVERVRDGSLAFQCGCVAADALTTRGDGERADDMLRQALSRGRRCGLSMVPFWRRDLMARVCVRALERGIEVDYARRLVIGHDLEPPGPDPERWPWPVRILAFGGFGLEPYEGGHENVRLGGKQLELLSALVALGGRDVPEPRLSALLWPESEPDKARRAFEGVLHRLRKTVGTTVLRRHNWRLSIDGRRCWVDRWAFERLCDAELPSGEDELWAHGRRLLSIYRGRLLPELDAMWIRPIRERLHRAFVRTVRRCASALADQDPERGATLYELAFEVDADLEVLDARDDGGR